MMDIDNITPFPNPSERRLRETEAYYRELEAHTLPELPEALSDAISRLGFYCNRLGYAEAMEKLARTMAHDDEWDNLWEERRRVAQQEQSKHYDDLIALLNQYNQDDGW